MPNRASRKDRLKADSVPPTDPADTSTTQSANRPRIFPTALRVEPISPFSERWNAKLADHQLFVSLWREFASLCEANGIHLLPDELLVDWSASWGKNAIEGFLLPKHPTLSRGDFESAVSSIASFSNAYRYIFPELAYPDAKRIWFYELPRDHGQGMMPKAEHLWRLMPELRLHPGTPIDAWPRGRLDQRRFFERASIFLNSPTPKDWDWLRSLAWATDTNQRISGDGVPYDRWAQLLRVSVPVISNALATDYDPRIVDPSTHFDVLMALVENWCRACVLGMRTRNGEAASGMNPSANTPNLHDKETNPPPQNGIQTPEGAKQKKKSDPNRPSQDRQSDILTVIQEKGIPLQRLEIISALKLKTEGKLGHHLAWMTENGILVNISQNGYWPKDKAVPE
ncbi:MAG: hypothetical protein KF873_23165 [Gemmataceae bacterium]|nr:hypothetical protein [Gemmataceae bacterium]